jgi:hypothetical protein
MSPTLWQPIEYSTMHARHQLSYAGDADSMFSTAHNAIVHSGRLLFSRS